MELKIMWLLLLLIISLIDHSFSAVFFPFEDRYPQDDYEKSISASVHRGLFLSYSLDKKIEMCRDLFSAYFEESTIISDGLENVGKPQHSLTVEDIRNFMPDKSLANKEKAIFFKCSGKNLVPKYTNEREYFVSSTFQPGLMYMGTEVLASGEESGIMLENYFGLSPEFIELKQTELEEQYVTMRQTIKRLREKSPNYVQMIEGRDDISELSTWQKFLLCSSITLSPNYEEDRRTFYIRWDKYKESAEKDKIDLYRRKCLKFNNEEYQKGNWCAFCLYCSPVKEADESKPHLKNLLITRSYNDKYSLYTLLEQKGEVTLKEYIENAPILMNTHVEFTDDPKEIRPVQEE